MITGVADAEITITSIWDFNEEPFSIPFIYCNGVEGKF